MSTMTDREPRRSAWPYAIAAALAAMVVGSLAVLAIAVTHPDPEVETHPLAQHGAPPRAAR